jgi:lipid-A-disaccharide synthase
MPNSKKILIVAGEASGDLYASQLINEINKLASGIKFFGLGGAKMQQQGCEICFKMTDLAVVGLFEVLKNLKTDFSSAVAKGRPRSPRPCRPG